MAERAHQLQQLADRHAPRRAKVMFVHIDSMLQILSGRARIRNLPSDAEIVAASPVEFSNQRGFGLRVHSACYPPVSYYDPLPVFNAVLEKCS